METALEHWLDEAVEAQEAKPNSPSLGAFLSKSILQRGGARCRCREGTKDVQKMDVVLCEGNRSISAASGKCMFLVVYLLIFVSLTYLPFHFS